MLASITPLGERGRGSRWGVTMAFFFAGSVGAGLIAGGVLAAAGRLFLVAHIAGTPRLVALGALVILGCLVDAGRTGLRLPTIHRQVNEQWLFQYRGWFYGVGFGFQLGLGVVTIVTTSAVYLWLAAALLSASPVGGAMIGVTFGLTRAATVLGAGWIRTPDRLASMGRALDRWSAPSRRATLAGMLAVAMGVGAVAVW